MIKSKMPLSESNYFKYRIEALAACYFNPDGTPLEKKYNETLQISIVDILIDFEKQLLNKPYMISTYLDQNELKQFQRCNDKEINELLIELEAIFGPQQWFIQETVYEGVKRLFRPKTPDLVLYTLYVNDRHGGVNIVNFASDYGPSINTTVPKSYIITYFLGIITGHNYTKEGLTMDLKDKLKGKL